MNQPPRIEGRGPSFHGADILVGRAADLPVDRAGPRPHALRLTDGRAGLETCATLHGRRKAPSVHGHDSRPILEVLRTNEKGGQVLRPAPCDFREEVR